MSFTLSTHKYTDVEGCSLMASVFPKAGLFLRVRGMSGKPTDLSIPHADAIALRDWLNEQDL
jgi:hypothetical protein